MKPLPEEIVKKNIINRLIHNDEVNINNIHVSVEEDKVFLQGHVPTYSGKLGAFQDAVKSAKGYAVVNELQVYFQASGPAVSDKTILDNIHQHFKWQNSIDATNVEMEVNNGKVILSGFVSNPSESVAGEKIVGTVQGVTEVENRIQVKSGIMSQDERIRAELLEAFENSALIDEKKIETQVDNGKVTLSGCVANDPIKKEIDDQALHVKGVKEVISKITIG